MSSNEIIGRKSAKEYHGFGFGSGFGFMLLCIKYEATGMNAKTSSDINTEKKWGPNS